MSSLPQRERWECPNCGTPLNIASLGIYAKVACPACGHIDHVHTMLANFRLEGVLGLGGMSVVLRARDLVLERPLAIKLLNEFYRDQPERIARFEQECELMAKVRHENVVSVYSAGRVKGQFYIAMELVNGRNLEELVRECGPLAPERALDILSQVVQGLAAACKAGLLHRDMKPGNVLICEDDHAKVLDFGLSLGKRDANTEEIIWATPYYVSPETLMREAEDSRTDIYALGMTLRYLLTGQQQFESVPEGIDEILVCKQALPPMATLLPDLPESYCDLVDHMTAYEPADRPESYASLLEEIAEVRASLAGASARLPLALRLKRQLPLLAGVALTLALGGGAAAISAHVSTPEPDALYVTPAQKLPWQERDTLDAAMAALQAGNTQQAAILFTQLADSEAEPTASAWASLHAWMLACLHGADEAELSRLRDRLACHLARTPVSAGQQWHDQMLSLQKADARPENKFMQAVLSVERLQASAAACREKEFRQHLKDADSQLRVAGRAYASVVKLLPGYEERFAERLPERAAELCTHSLSLLDIPEATRALTCLQACSSDNEASARLAVRREALELFREAVEMMKRRSLLPSEGTPVSPEDLQRLLLPLEDAALSAELAALMHVARGEFDRAAALNPHAKAVDSPEPFAVMMRDWLARAIPGQGQDAPPEPLPAPKTQDAMWEEYADIED